MDICGAAVHRVEPNHKTLAILLASLCLVVLLVIVLERQYPPQLESKINTRDTKANSVEIVSQGREVEAISLSSLGTYAEITERPLFRPSRRPPDPVKAVSEAQQAAEKAKQEQVHIEELFALSGVVITKNETVALLHDIKNNKNLRVSEGEKVSGWRIDRVFPDRVLFSHNGRGEALELIRDFGLVPPNAQHKRRRTARKRR